MDNNTSFKRNITIANKINLKKNVDKTKLYPSGHQVSSPNCPKHKKTFLTHKKNTSNWPIASRVNYNLSTQSYINNQKFDNHASYKNMPKNKSSSRYNITNIKKSKNSNENKCIYKHKLEKIGIGSNKKVYLISKTEDNDSNKFIERCIYPNKANNNNNNNLFNILDKLEKNNNNKKRNNNKSKNISKLEFYNENKAVKDPQKLKNSSKNSNIEKCNLNTNENKNFINVQLRNYSRNYTDSNINNDNELEYTNICPTKKKCRINTSPIDDHLLNVFENKKNHNNSNNNLMVNYKIIKIKNNINNINNNTNHYNYNNYLLNSETDSNNNFLLNSLGESMNLIGSIKNNKRNIMNKYIAKNHYIENVPTKNKKITVPNYASLCKNIAFYNRFRNTFYRTFNTNNNNMNDKKKYNINVNRPYSLSPNKQSLYQHSDYDNISLKEEKYYNFFNSMNNEKNIDRNMLKTNSLFNIHNFNFNNKSFNSNIDSAKNTHLKTGSANFFKNSEIINKTEGSKKTNKLIKNVLLNKNYNSEPNTNFLNGLEKYGNCKFANTCAIKSKIANYIDQTNSINNSCYSNNTIHNKQNSLRIYIKPGAVNKMPKTNSKNDYINIIQNDNKVSNKYKKYKQNDTDDFLSNNDKIMHFSRSEYFDNELLSHSEKKRNKYQYENNLSNIDNDSQKKLLINRINVKTTYGGFNTQNIEKWKLKTKKNVVKEIKKKKNHCFINKMYSYYIKIKKLDKCFYTKINKNNKIKNKEIYVHCKKKAHLSKKNFTSNNKKTNIEKTYTKKKKENSDLQLKNANTIQESLTYTKTNSILKKNLFIYKLKENTNNIKNKEKILKGLRKLVNFFDKKNISKILKNKVNERIKSFILTPRHNNTSDESKINYKNSLINENNIKNLKTYNYKYILSLKNNIYSIKDNLLPEKLIRHSFELFIQTDFELVSNNILEPDENYYINEINKNQPKNNFKLDIMNLLNALTIKTFDNIFSKILYLLLINKQNNNLFIENEKNLLKIIFSKASNEYCYGFIYAKLCSELNIKLLNEFIDTKNDKNNKERNIKFLINEESNNVFNKFKNMKTNDLILNKNKFLGYINFISELIIIELLKQQFIFYIFDQMYQKYLENKTEVIYLEGCIELINNTGKNIIEKENNTKNINNLNKYLNETFPNLLSNKASLPSNIKYKIINLLEKNKNGWNKTLYEFSKSFNNNSKNSLLFSIDFEDSNISTNDNLKISNENSKTQDKVSVKNVIETDLLNYLKYSSDNNEKPPIYNWEVIDKLIKLKNIQIYKIIIYYIKICKNIIDNEKNIIYSNNYIKNIMEYYSNNMSKKDIDIMRNEMIKFFKNTNEIISEDEKMYKIMGNLLFVLIENRIFLIKDFNNFLKESKKTIINLSLVTKYCIISSGKYAKKYYNDFRQTKLFIYNNEIFKKNVSESLKDLFYYIK